MTWKRTLTRYTTYTRTLVPTSSGVRKGGSRRCGGAPGRTAARRRAVTDEEAVPARDMRKIASNSVLARPREVIPYDKLLRGCYELAQEWLANAENGRPTLNRAKRRIRILMRFFNQVHNTVNTL